MFSELLVDYDFLKAQKKGVDIVNPFLPSLAKEVFTTSLNNGFWVEDIMSDGSPFSTNYFRDIEEAKLLIITELAEFVEAKRDTSRRPLDISVIVKEIISKEENTLIDYLKLIKTKIKGSPEEELADTIIRIMDLYSGVFPTREFQLPAYDSGLLVNTTHNYIMLSIIGRLAMQLEDFQLEYALIDAASLLITSLGYHPVDILVIMYIKNEYNKTRGYKHGKAF